MADYSSSGLEGMGLPSLTHDSVSGTGDPRVLGWIKEAVMEGDRINRSDPFYDRAEIGMRYVSGDQRVNAENAAEPPAYLPRTTLNESRRVVNAHVSALTDLKPLFSYKSMDPAFTLQADYLNKLTVAWWVTAMADIELGYVIKYAEAAGTGDLVTEWNPYTTLGGDIAIQARDFRDTLPIRPAPHGRSVQNWEGLILRESHTVNVLRSLYPQYASAFRPTTDSMLSTLMGRFRQISGRFLSPANDTLSGLNAPAMASRVRSGEILLYRTYLNDRSQNLTNKAIPMGTPGASWSYIVPPGGYLYPYKRMVVSTPEQILYDGPSPYWHGQYPVSRLKMWDLPWHFLGQGLLNDLIPMQDGINQSIQDVLLGIRKWMDPAVVYDRGAVSESFMRLYDARRPGSKVKLNPTGSKEGFKPLEGPPPQVMQLSLEIIQFLLQRFDSLSGTPNLQEILALRQLPAADTIDKALQALTPELRQEGRQVEAFLRDVGEQSKVLRFQYESSARRVTILGDAGTLLQDFDFDPEVLVPALTPGTPGYSPLIDAQLTRDQRAQGVHKKIVFVLAPNSILSLNAMEGKLMKLQLSRMGMMDVWSLWEALEIPNAGAPPKIPLPPLKPLDPQIVQQVMLQAQQDPALAAQLSQQYTIDPASGQILEIREPVTIVERLQCQGMLGIGMTASPAGRKASGQAPPAMEQKSDGRTTVTESHHDRGENSKPGPGT
jgi:hypothetical protein